MRSLGCSASDDLACHLAVRAVGTQRLPCSTMPRQPPSVPSSYHGLISAESSFFLAEHFLGVRILLMDIGLAAGDSRRGGRAGRCQVGCRCRTDRLDRSEPAARLNAGDIATDLLLHVNSRRPGLRSPIGTANLDLEASLPFHSQIAVRESAPCDCSPLRFLPFSDSRTANACRGRAAPRNAPARTTYLVQGSLRETAKVPRLVPVARRLRDRRTPLCTGRAPR